MTAATRTAPGAAEPTSFPVVIAQPPGSVTRVRGGVPPIAVVGAIGGAMLLVGVGVGAWVMLGDSPQVERMDRVAAARIELPDSTGTPDGEPSAAPSADADATPPPIDEEGEDGPPSSGPPTASPKTPATQLPPKAGQPKPPNNSMKTNEDKAKEKEKEKGKGKGKKKKKDD